MKRKMQKQAEAELGQALLKLDQFVAKWGANTISSSQTKINHLAPLGDPRIKKFFCTVLIQVSLEVIDVISLNTLYV